MCLLSSLLCVGGVGVVCLCECIQTSEDNFECPSSGTIYYLLGTGSLIGQELCRVNWASWLESSRQSISVYHLTATTSVNPLPLAFIYMGSGVGINLGPYAYKASTLLTEPIAQPQPSSLQKKIWTPFILRVIKDTLSISIAFSYALSYSSLKELCGFKGLCNQPIWMIQNNLPILTPAVYIIMAKSFYCTIKHLHRWCRFPFCML